MIWRRNSQQSKSPIFLIINRNKMKNILIALDYGPTAQKVAEVGFEFASALGAKVVLLHVISDPVYYNADDYSPIMGFTGYLNTDPLQPDVVGMIKTASLDFLNKTKIHLGEPTIQTIVAEGDFAEAILKSAKNLSADVIVLGSHSRKWLENIVLGSVTEKVLHHTTIPLFIVPTRKK